jgi:hypothetical protein
MIKQELTSGSFTIKLGHPALIFLWSTWMLLLGCVIGMHWHRSHSVVVCVSLACAVLIVVHEMIDGFVWCTMTAWWLGRCQRDRIW